MRIRHVSVFVRRLPLHLAVRTGHSHANKCTKIGQKAVLGHARATHLCARILAQPFMCCACAIRSSPTTLIVRHGDKAGLIVQTCTRTRTHTYTHTHTHIHARVRMHAHAYART